MNKEIKRKKFNIIVLGEGNVGKTSIIKFLKNNYFEEDILSTVGMDYYNVEKEIDGVTYTFKIFDTAGQERYKSISTSTIKLADGFLIVYAVDNRNSFQQIQFWIKTIIEQTDINKKPIILVGNKIDLPRVISTEEGTNYSQEKQFKYFETSAKTGDNIKEVFNELYLDIYNLKSKTNENFKIRKKSQKITKKRKC